MKTLITHPRPHLDDLAGMWLLKRFDPAHKVARLKFVSTLQAAKHISRDAVLIGIGRGKFDEHKGDVNECAASLVWKEVRRKVSEPVRRNALDRLVAWISEEDRGLHDDRSDRIVSIPSLLRAYYELHEKNSQKLARIGFDFLNAMLWNYEQEVALERDWKRRRDFQSPWGKATALTSSVADADLYAYARGYVLVLLANPSNGYRAFRAPAWGTVNLTAVYRRVIKEEPRASWYLHHSKKLLLAGSDVAPDARPSKLTLQKMISYVRRR